MAQPVRPEPTLLEFCTIGSLKPHPRNARRHSPRQITKLAAAIREFGFHVPLVIDDANTVLCGHARLEALKKLKWKEAPCIRVSHLTAEQRIAFAIADNKLGDLSSFDEDALRELLQPLALSDFNLELTGFETGELDVLFDPPVGAKARSDPADTFEAPDPNRRAVTRRGDLWRLGDHALLCGDALQPASYEHVLGGARAHMVFTDPPYNTRIRGRVSGRGKTKHREFAMASGEMSEDEFGAFLSEISSQLVAFSVDGSIHYLCMDWRQLRLLLTIGLGLYTELKNICCWVKTNAGMGSLYRSQHEFVVVFKNGRAPHTNNVQLGRHGRWRSNVWEYAGANSFGATRDGDLQAHPTVKPVGLVADAIRDCSRRGEIILDPFMGSGTTILAAERTDRHARGIELDPLYVDTAIGRWERLTGKTARLDGCDLTFAEVAHDRAAEDAS